MSPPTTRKAMLKVIRDANGEWITRSEIAVAIGVKHLTTHHVIGLKHLYRRGHIDVKRGGNIYMYRSK